MFFYITISVCQQPQWLRYLTLAFLFLATHQIVHNQFDYLSRGWDWGGFDLFILTHPCSSSEYVFDLSRLGVIAILISFDHNDLFPYSKFICISLFLFLIRESCSLQHLV